MSLKGIWQAGKNFLADPSTLGAKAKAIELHYQGRVMLPSETLERYKTEINKAYENSNQLNPKNPSADVRGVMKVVKQNPKLFRKHGMNWG
jgi:NAD(P)H-dependent flavin oxidoreductase YrpB (nitropropane dioxygenase family)